MRMFTPVYTYSTKTNLLHAHTEQALLLCDFTTKRQIVYWTDPGPGKRYRRLTQLIIKAFHHGYQHSAHP